MTKQDRQKIREVKATFKTLVDKALDARNNALEEAAKIVEAFEPLRGLRPDVEKHDEGMREMLASSIRARKDKNK